MNCKVCGAELKKPGELCNNCMNAMMKEQEMRNDKSEHYTFHTSFALGYELLRHIEQICIVVFMIILLLTVSLSFWRYAVIVGCVFSIIGILAMWRIRLITNSGVCTLYATKLVYKYGFFKKKVKEIPYSEIEEIYYSVGNAQRVFKMGTIVIKKKTRNILERNIFIEPVKDIETVFGKIEEVFK